MPPHGIPCRRPSLDGTLGAIRDRPTITLLPDGRLRYDDLARYEDHFIRDVAAGIEVGLGSQPYPFKWLKTRDPNEFHCQRTETYPIQKATVTFDLHIYFKQVGHPDVPYASIVEVGSVMETLEPVT